jgi:hypothetical protein
VVAEARRSRGCCIRLETGYRPAYPGSVLGTGTDNTSLSTLLIARRSQVVDFDGTLLAEASPGPGERIVTAPIDISALRHERSTHVGHHMLAHLRTEAYPVYAAHRYPPRQHSAWSDETNVDMVEIANRQIDDTVQALKPT